MLNPTDAILTEHKHSNDFCFVLMPFNENWSSRIYNKHLKPAIENSGFECNRADDFFSSNVIVDDIFSHIVDAKIIIADLTNKNPNVFYELGIAHTLGKPVILLSQDARELPFDTAHRRQIIYSDNSEGCELLEASLKKSIDYIKEVFYPFLDLKR